MTKEKLEKEAEEYAGNTYEMCSYSSLPYASDRRARQQAFLAGAEPREKRIAELEAQIEKMKCCGNCENGELSAHEEPCLHCQRCFASKDVTDQENVKDNWEAIKEIKEK